MRYHPVQTFTLKFANFLLYFIFLDSSKTPRPIVSWGVRLLDFFRHFDNVTVEYLPVLEHKPISLDLLQARKSICGMSVCELLTGIVRLNQC